LPDYNKPQAIACNSSRTEITRFRTFSSKSWRALLTRFLRRRRARPLQSAAQAWCRQKIHVLQMHQAMRVERRGSSQVQPVAPRFVIAKVEVLFLRQSEYPWQSQGCRA